jgi:hypothetical protein
MTCRLADGLVLPSQLQRLQLVSHDSNLEAVLQLQQLHLHVRFQEVGLLQQLTQLTGLQRLTLAYSKAADAAATAAAWPQLQQLRQLDMDVAHNTYFRQELKAITRHVAACTGFTQLHLAGHVAVVCAERTISLAACPVMQDMRINWNGELAAGQGLWLTDFTALTRLDCVEAYDGVGSKVAIHLAGSLKQLQHLDLRSCGLHSVECMAAIAQLTQLTELRLEGNDGLTQQGLMLLTGLKRLQRLGLSEGHLAVETVKDLWSKVQDRGSNAMQLT